MQKQSFLFSRDATWPPSDKGLFTMSKNILVHPEGSSYSFLFSESRVGPFSPSHEILMRASMGG